VLGSRLLDCEFPRTFWPQQAMSIVLSHWNFSVIQTAIRAILRSTTDFEVNGPLEYARMPEMGLIGCPLKFHCADEILVERTR